MNKNELGQKILCETFDKAIKFWNTQSKFDEKIDRLMFSITIRQFDFVKLAFDLEPKVNNYSFEKYEGFIYKNFEFTICHNRKMNTYDFCGHSLNYIKDDEERWSYIEKGGSL